MCAKAHTWHHNRQAQKQQDKDREKVIPLQVLVGLDLKTKLGLLSLLLEKLLCWSYLRFLLLFYLLGASLKTSGPVQWHKTIFNFLLSIQFSFSDGKSENLFIPWSFRTFFQLRKLENKFILYCILVGEKWQNGNHVQINLFSRIFFIFWHQ